MARFRYVQGIMPISGSDSHVIWLAMAVRHEMPVFSHILSNKEELERRRALITTCLVLIWLYVVLCLIEPVGSPDLTQP